MLYDLADSADIAQAALKAPHDVIIVGSGAVGLTMALTLTRQGARVLCLEAGPAHLEATSQALFNEARATANPLPGLHQGRFRMLGGTTNFWGGQLAPFDPIVFEKRGWIGAPAWPISREILSPFYASTLDLLNMSGVLTETAAVTRRLRLQPPADTRELELFFTSWTPEANFARLFAHDIATNARLDLIINAPVTGLAVGAPGHIDNVRIRFPDGGAGAARAPLIVLANGTVEIARLLQMKLVDDRPSPWQDLPWLGRGFMDHLDAYAADVDVTDRKAFHLIFDNAVIDGIKYTPKLKLSAAAQRAHHLYGLAAHFMFNSSLGDHIANAKLFVKGLRQGRLATDALSLTALGALLRVAAPMVARYVRYRRIYNFCDGGIKLRLTGEHRVLREGRVKLAAATDRLAMPVATVDWRTGGDEIESFARFAEWIDAYLRENRLAQLRIDPRLAARDPAFAAQFDDANHHMGTARMSLHPQDGVVDADLRVHGADNLYVAGAAVFPGSGFANPTFTAMALGQRLAAHLMQKLQHGR